MIIVYIKYIYDLCDQYACKLKISKETNSKIIAKKV